MGQRKGTEGAENIRNVTVADGLTVSLLLQTKPAHVFHQVVKIPEPHVGDANLSTKAEIDKIPSDCDRN